MEENEKMNPSDHDILIDMKSTLGRVVNDIKDIKDNIYMRINNLERDKVNKADALIEAGRLEKLVEGVAHTLSETVKTTAKTLSDATELIRKDYEERLRTLETARTQIKTLVAISIVVIPIISVLIAHFIK